MPAHSVGDVPDQRPNDVTVDPKTPNQQTSSAALDERQLTPAKWGIGWQCPTLMIGPVICGALLAVGHHLYYDNLNDTRVNSINQQTWAIRIGTGFAFLIRSFLTSAVGLAAVQQLWATLRKKSIRLYGIDSMFAVMGSPLALLTWDIWIYAKTLTLLAIVGWLVYTPCCTFSPSTNYCFQAHPPNRHRHAGHPLSPPPHNDQYHAAPCPNG
jgi:hypothetical protein